MKFLPLTRLVVACAMILAPTARLAAQDLPPPQNTDALLKELEQISSGSQSLSQKRRIEAVSLIQSASASGPTSVELYVTALDNTKYRENHQGFIDWKQKNQDDLRHPSYQNAVQLQLRYLLLGLQRSEQKTALAQVPETLAYLNALSSLHFLEGTYSNPSVAKGAKAPPIPSDKVTPEAASVIKQPLTSSPVVEWLRIEDLLPTGKDFETSAGNYAGILEKNLKTPLRGTNDPRLPSVWDLQINTESAVTSAANSKQKEEVFRNERLPELVFGKLKDTAAIGQPNRASTDMMKLIRSYPLNPSVKDWINYARGLLTNQPSAPTNSPAAAPTTNAVTPQRPSTTGS
ncbi:MAG: hypothetical protein ACOYOI_02705 [Chthoniobacterales bacterium]